MDAKAEGQVLTGPVAVDNELIGPLNHRVIAVARNVPHDHPVTLADLLALEFDILRRGPAHMGQRRLPTDNLRNHVRDQARIGLELVIFPRKLVQGQDPARDRVARRIIAADDQQDQIAQKLHRIIDHILGVRIVGQQGNEVELRLSRRPLMPQGGEIAEALHQGALTLGHIDRHAHRL